MLIGIHSVAAFKEQRTGVEEYAYQLIKHFIELVEAGDPKAVSFILYTGRISGDLEKIISGKSHISAKKLAFPFLWTQIRLSLEMIFNPPDVLFSPAHILPLYRPKKSVVTVHDLGYERFPGHYQFFFRRYLRLATKFSCRAASKIIVPSQSAKNDLVELYGVPPEKISVIYHGFNENLAAAKTAPAESAGGGYFLYLGRIEFKKNVGGIVRAFEIFKEKRKSPRKLVLAGGGGFGAEELKERIKKSKFASDIVLKGYVPEEEKAALLRNAAIFLFPSFYEGFGLPILEAQAAGVPVIASNVSSMPEIAGKGASLVEPSDVEEIAEKMYKIISDENSRKELIKNGFENVKKFSWEKCARETLRTLCERL